MELALIHTMSSPDNQQGPANGIPDGGQLAVQRRKSRVATTEYDSPRHRRAMYAHLPFKTGIPIGAGLRFHVPVRLDESISLSIACSHYMHLGPLMARLYVSGLIGPFNNPICPCLRTTPFVVFANFARWLSYSQEKGRISI